MPVAALTLSDDSPAFGEAYILEGPVLTAGAGSDRKEEHIRLEQALPFVYYLPYVLMASTKNVRMSYP